jgi:hypothetical protein
MERIKQLKYLENLNNTKINKLIMCTFMPKPIEVNINEFGEQRTDAHVQTYTKFTLCS